MGSVAVFRGRGGRPRASALRCGRHAPDRRQLLGVLAVGAYDGAATISRKRCDQSASSWGFIASRAPCTPPVFRAEATFREQRRQRYQATKRSKLHRHL